MKRGFFVTALLLSGLSYGAFAQQAKQPVDYVSPNIGGIGQLLTATDPYVQRPHGMARLEPIVTPGIKDRYLADKIYGFPAGPAVLMASTTEAKGTTATEAATYASDCDHDFETATPYYYGVPLDSSGVKAEFTATTEAAYYRFTFPASQHGHVVLHMANGAELQVIGHNAVSGSETVQEETWKPTGETREYFYAEFSKPFTSFQTWKAGELSGDSAQKGDSIGFLASNETKAGDVIEVRVGISYISADQAKRNLRREIPAWNFEQTKAAGRAVWNDTLGAVDTTGGTERQRTIFYTALYRSLGRMTDITEDGKYFSGYDHSVHDAQGHDFYVDDGLWDTFRSMHPLQLLLNAKSQEDAIRSYTRMYEQSGWLPSFPSVGGERAIMIGHHAAELIADTYSKGYRDFDVEKAYEGIRKNATETTLLPWSRAPLTPADHIYFDKGFFPALAKGEKEPMPEVTGELRQAVSVTLENSYDDWSVAQLAKALGKTEDVERFTKLAHNYQNLWNPQIGFMAPKSADGEWVEDFDPKLGGGQGGRNYTTEVDSWLYTFNVQFDVAGLIHLMGGNDAFNKKLDQLFIEQYGVPKYQFLGQFPDATGLVGLYAQGNEPSYHIPYLYDFSGQPWKAQKRVRELMDVWYTDDTHGIPGDEDGGETSSWYVFSAMGFYPVCPGSPVYEIGSPIFEKTALRMGNGKVFTILADGVSAKNKYIQSAKLNGKELKTAWFEHAAIANGGTLELTMGPEPNRSWGSSPEDTPPSMSK